MQILYIYGPPGVGKLTVAKELSKLTGYKLFHNHLTVDLVSNIFEFGSKDYRNLIIKLRKLVITEAVKKNVNLIFTYFYTFPDDNDFIESLLKDLENIPHDILFVQLLCDESELSIRIKNLEREKFLKLKDEDILNEILSKYDYKTPIPFGKTLTIDNTALSPEEVANIIINKIKTKTI